MASGKRHKICASVGFFYQILFGESSLFSFFNVMWVFPLELIVVVSFYLVFLHHAEKHPEDNK